VFGRGKSEQTPTTPVGDSLTKESGKGRPTPSRREAEQRNYRPIVAGKALSPTASKAERKAARAEQRVAMNSQRAIQRQALMTGDEAHLPARDRGPARRWARDYVDARRSVGEYFLPVALVILGLSLIRQPTVALAAIVLLYGMVLVVAVDCFLVRRKLSRLLTAKFGASASQGAPTYAMLRMLQLRRSRLPRPQVARGQFPE